MKRAPNLFWTGMVCLSLGSGLFLIAPLLNAQTSVKVRIQGIANPVHIGDIRWTVERNNRGDDEILGVFRFRPDWAHLDDRYDFRWFQIVKSLGRNDNNQGPKLPKWFDGSAWSTPNAPFVDPANGGWDYMYGDDHVANGGTRNTRNRGEGADDSPFYENDGGSRADGSEENPWEYWYPGFNDRYAPGGPFVHEERVYSSFGDAPRNSVAGTSITFQVFLSVVNRGSNFLELVNEDRAFGKLIGFDWVARFESVGGRVLTRIEPPTLVDRNKKPDVQSALDSSGFTGWTSLNDVELVPEPASLLALALGLAGLARRRRRCTA